MTVVVVHVLVLGVLGLVRIVESASGFAQEPPSAGKDAPASLVAVPSECPRTVRRVSRGKPRGRPRGLGDSGRCAPHLFRVQRPRPRPERDDTRGLRMLKMLYDAGLPIVAGTDAIAGFSLHSELEQYVAAGIPAPKALQIATLGAARVMKRDGEAGSIAPGKAADLILVDGDPSVKIADIRRVVTVIRGTNVYDAGALYAALGVRPVPTASRAH